MICHLVYRLLDSAGIISMRINPAIIDARVHASHKTPATENMLALYISQLVLVTRIVQRTDVVFLLPYAIVDNILATIINMLLGPCHETMPNTKNSIAKNTIEFVVFLSFFI